MKVLVDAFVMAGNPVIFILGIAEPDVKDPFWEE